MEIRRVTFELYVQGVNPIRRNVGLRLSKPGAFVEKAAQTAHQNALRELGLIKAGWVNDAIYGYAGILESIVLPEQLEA